MIEGRRKSKRWHRDRMVAGTLCGSVVASTKTAWTGGSSRVLSRALKASGVSMWTSSTMYTFMRPSTGEKCTLSRRSRMSSMPRLEAASISTTSIALPRRMAWQCGQVPSGSAVALPCPASQLRAMARILAVEVLPVPRGPVKRYAWLTRSFLMALTSVRATWSCPMMSSKRAGRYLRYRETDMRPMTPSPRWRPPPRSTCPLGSAAAARAAGGDEGRVLGQKGPCTHL